MNNIVGKGKWNLNALEAATFGWLGDKAVCEPDSEGRVEFSLVTLSSGANGCHQPADIFSDLNMSPPEDVDADSYNPDDDEWIWEDIEEAAEKDSESPPSARIVTEPAKPHPFAHLPASRLISRKGGSP